MNLEEFINDIKEQELNLYRNCIEALKTEYNTGKYNGDLQSFWRYVNDSICSDYDVQEQFRKEVFNDKNYANIERDIQAHTEKLQKNITKVVGVVDSIEETGDSEYQIKGSKADCTVKVTPAKLSSSKSITKTRVKVLDVNEHEEELVEKESSAFEDSQYVKEWKAQELKEYKEALEVWKENLEKLNKELEEAKQHLRDAVDEYIKDNDKSPEVEKGRYVDTKLNGVLKEKNTAEYKYTNYKNKNSLFSEYGYSSRFEEEAKKIIDNHYKLLQSKVEKKIGRIIKIKSLGGDDYSFEGEKGSCVIEVIWAGGYNIQRLHTRWIVKNSL